MCEYLFSVWGFCFHKGIFAEVYIIKKKVWFFQIFYFICQFGTSLKEFSIISLSCQVYWHKVVPILPHYDFDIGSLFNHDINDLCFLSLDSSSWGLSMFQRMTFLFKNIQNHLFLFQQESLLFPSFLCLWV